MNTKRYRTRTEFIERNNGKADGVWEIALDIGYSAVKGFSPNGIRCFPSYARRIDDSFNYATIPPKESIIYRNLITDEMWLVGEVAQNTMKDGDTNDSEASLYGRERYMNPMFKVISEVGLGLNMIGNEHGERGDDRIVIQTGLPERYMGDEYDLKEALAGKHDFALRVGAGEWIKFSFDISKDDIYVMSQPKGTLFSVCIDKNGQFHPDAANYLRSSILVFDPGFGTLDLFPIVSGVVGHGETYSDLGMKRVLQETCRLIKENLEVDKDVPSMQKALENGTVRYTNKRTFTSEDRPFDKLLAVASDRICDEAISRMMSSINLTDYNYMIVTGGTGAAWLNRIQEKFKNFSTLKILQGNQNDDLPFIYSNVRGYYLYRYNKLCKKQG